MGLAAFRLSFDRFLPVLAISLRFLNGKESSLFASSFRGGENLLRLPIVFLRQSFGDWRDLA